MVPRLFDSMTAATTYEPVGGLPLLWLHRPRRGGWQYAVKHASDRVAAGLLLLAVAPLLGLLAALVRWSSPGPALFRQRRVGRDGREFELLKLRSMRVAEMHPRWAPKAGRAPGGIEGADRRTAVGRFLRRTSLDELPQLVNVVRGEMSLVGPRPERPEFVALFEEHVGRYAERHRVRPGMTGWAQVHGLRGGRASVEDRIAWDNFYVEHWSLGLDLRILALTALAVLRAAE
jgi:lipopolysaccharide/colanic/teichoic acid biosynthesis glycosyltransferase